MSFASDIIGTHYRYPDYYLVGREKIREYAAAIQSDDPLHFSEEAAKAAGYPNVVAPLTFIAIPGRQVQLDIFRNFDVGINIARVIHRDQKITFHRPIFAGDKLYFDSWLESVVESFGAVISTLRTGCRLTSKRRTTSMLSAMKYPALRRSSASVILT